MDTAAAESDLVRFVGLLKERRTQSIPLWTTIRS